MTLDGQPVQWASLLLTGKKNEKTQEVAMVRLAVRDGKFATEGRSTGTTPGENAVEIIIYAEEPREEVDRPKIIGMWNGAVTVEKGQPLTLNLNSSELNRPGQ